MKPVSIYIHIPFCKSKCFYCDFLSYPNMDKFYKQYLDALILEIKNTALLFKDYQIETIFIGGGTPTILPSFYIQEIMKILDSYYNLSKCNEITIEANPGTVDYNKLLELKELKINRISFGLQAWQNRLLKKLGRIYSRNEFINNLNLSRQAGFDNINVDLMFSLPTQSIEEWEETLNKIVELKPEHISTYGLIIEDNTVFGKLYAENKLEVTDEVIDRQMYYRAKQILKHNGYIHYEISNFAQSNFESKHNLAYWQQKEYISFGLGAHSYINKMRFHNTYDFCKYIECSKNKKDITEDIETNDILDEYAEFMFLGLRLLKGISKAEFKLKFNKDIEQIYKNQLDECKNYGLLEEDDNNIYLTNKGIDVSNIVFEKFLIK